MPWTQSWTPARQEPELKVRKRLPKSLADRLKAEEKEFGKTNRTEIGDLVGGKYVEFHYCRNCKGWIEGPTNEYGEDTIGPLSGRCGTSHCCRRCGTEVYFSGILS
jgi:hypothetical protein